VQRHLRWTSGVLRRQLSPTVGALRVFYDVTLGATSRFPAEGGEAIAQILFGTRCSL
jgi:hypothetical protein